MTQGEVAKTIVPNIDNLSARPKVCMDYNKIIGRYPVHTTDTGSKQVPEVHMMICHYSLWNWCLYDRIFKQYTVYTVLLYTTL